MNRPFVLVVVLVLDWRTLFRGRRRARGRSGIWFKVPVHGIEVVSALHQPARPSNCSLPWESGAEDARTPNTAA